MQYQNDVTRVLNRLAPVKTKTFSDRPLVPWINEDIILSKKCKRRLEKQWRKTGLTVHYQMFKSEKKHLESLISKAKTDHYTNEIKECSNDQGRVFKIIAHLQNIKAKPTLPQYDTLLDLCNSFNEFFINKISTIRDKLDQMASGDTSLQLDSDPNPSSCAWESFNPVTTEEMLKVIKEASNASCDLDPIPTNILKNSY